MALTAYQSLIQLIRNGDAVDEASINRILRTLDGNTQYVKDVLEAALIGETVFARGVAVEEDALVGQPVYYNPVTKQFERALAQANVGADGVLSTSVSSQVWGVVYVKTSSTFADILLAGYAPLNLSNAVTGEVTAGLYYLSGTTAGKLQKTTPPIGVPVLQSDGEGKVHVRPSFSDLFNSHVHYRFELAAVEADDSSVEGWLPAADAIFGGKAPAGAIYGYNISQSVLANVWPPLPASSAYLEWNKGTDANVGGTGVQQATAAPLVKIDNYGIWWMSPDDTDLPWSGSLTPPTPGQDPRQLAMTFTLWFTKMQYQTNNTVVTSLRSANNKLKVLCAYDGSVRTTGDLELTLDLASLVDPADTEAGHMFIKRLDTTTQTFYRGPGVEALKQGANTLLTGTEITAGEFVGKVTVSAQINAGGWEFPIEEVRLSGVLEEDYMNTLGLGFPAQQDTEYRAKFKVPTAITGTLSVTLRFQILARAAGALPPLTITYRKVLPATSPEPLPLTDDNLTLDVSAGATMAIDEYVEVNSAAIIGLHAGDAVLFSVARAGASDGFVGDIHVIDQRAVVTGVS